MKPVSVVMAAAACALVLASCETNSRRAPPVNAAFLRAGGQKVSEAGTLEAGRAIFVSRCIACHALPKVAKYDATRIPGIVSVMSRRAHLSAEQRDSVTKYLLAVRAQ
jgi:mono/diheme cytochrome c family protein